MWRRSGHLPLVGVCGELVWWAPPHCSPEKVAHTIFFLNGEPSPHIVHPKKCPISCDLVIVAILVLSLLFALLFGKFLGQNN